MISSTNKSALIMVALVAATAMMMTVTEAQTTIPSCASKLTPCVNYLNSTNPPTSCCDPLRDAVTNERDCLCNLYASGLLPSLGINVTEVLRLPRYCNIDGDLSACPNVVAPGPSSTKPPPPAVPGGNNGNGVGKMSWSGISSVVLLLISMIMLS